MNIDIPNYFLSKSIVNISNKDFEAIKYVILKIENIISSSSYRNSILEKVKLNNTKQKGVFMSYDFHITSNQPKLIEINTNAGGGVLASYLFNKSEKSGNFPFDAYLENTLVDMFVCEYKLFNPIRPLKTIAIVDESPNGQYLYNEFLVLQKLFADYGIKVIIADPSELQIGNNSVLCQDEVIDLIYNRLTDFYFEKPENTVLKKAYDNQLVVITPNPTHHALFANKINLLALRASSLEDFIPKTNRVMSFEKEKLWENRKNYFFKPISSYGSKGVFCGKKITTSVWKNIDGNYIAQECIKAPEINVNGKKMRYDIRVFTYDGKILQAFARLYIGQATNFRTPEGGYAQLNITNSDKDFSGFSNKTIMESLLT